MVLMSILFMLFTKVFDKVDHNLLLSKLRKYVYHENVVSWIGSFLSDRSQHVVLNGTLSYAASVINGGPLLFILFVNDTENCVNSSTIRLFADDARILKYISPT